MFCERNLKKKIKSRHFKKKKISSTCVITTYIHTYLSKSLPFYEFYFPHLIKKNYIKQNKKKPIVKQKKIFLCEIIFYIQQIPQKLHIKQISDSYSYIYFYRKYDIFFSSKNVYFLLSHYHYQRRKNMFEKNKPPALTQKSSSKTEKFVNLIFLLLLTLLLCIV